MKSQAVACIALAFIVANGLYLRLNNLGGQSYWMDEGYTVNAVLSEMHNGTKNFSAILDSGKTYVCPLYCAPTELIIRTVYHGQTDHPAAYRLLAVIFGLVMIVVAYAAVKTFFQDQQAALIAALFTSYSYWQIAWGREARWYTELEVFFWLSLICFWLFLNATNKRKKILWLAFSLVSALAAIVTHRIAYLLPLVMLAWMALDARVNKKLLLIATGVGAAFILFVEFVLGFHLIGYALRDITLHNNLPLYALFYAKTYWVFILLTILGFVVGSPARRRTYALLLIPLGLYLFFLSFFTDVIQYRYLFHVMPAFYFIVAVAIVDLISLIDSRNRVPS